ncbi:MAG: hypothetical protein J2P45_08390 [Candidatus Dormibacteraeota bacterium]|nr:hypothetical protein [Candidatus Dormibacteraeota bacterium]
MMQHFTPTETSSQDPLADADLQTQFEGLLHEIWTREAEWRAEDRIDLAIRLGTLQSGRDAPS